MHYSDSEETIDAQISGYHSHPGGICFNRRLGTERAEPVRTLSLHPQVCATGVAGQPAYITQNGWDMNLLTEAGVPSRAWIDWPGHIWIQNFQEGAVYSPDGMTIQFDRGTIWQRDLGLPPPPPPPPRLHYK